MLRILVLAICFGAVALAVPKYFDRKNEQAKVVAAAGSVAQEPSKSRPRDGYRVALRANDSGHYYSNAVINGRSVDVIVDTGATTVALTEATARRLGLAPSKSAFVVRISTANGEINAAPVIINEIRIGGIRVRDVAAIVVPGNALGVNLLGMTFLNKLRKFESSGGQLVLIQ